MFRNKDGDVIWARVGLVGGVILFLLIAMAINIFTIGAGDVGVGFNPFKTYAGGTSVNPDEYQEGIHVKVPWVRVDRFNVKTQDYSMTWIEEEGVVAKDDRIRTVTSEGLYVDLDITMSGTYKC